MALGERIPNDLISVTILVEHTAGQRQNGNSPVERFADTLDLAEASLNQTTEAAISTIRKQLTDGHGRTNCLDCGVKIPEKRLVYVPNAVRCADCQDLLERRRMLFGTDNSINTVATGDSEEPDDF